MSKIQTRTGRFFSTIPIYLLCVFLGVFLGISVAAAGPLDQPKADGLIGEQANGYLGLVRQDAPADISALVNDVNAKRKTRYQGIARNQGLPLLEVERLGGTNTIERTSRGNYIKDGSGSWRKK